MLVLLFFKLQVKNNGIVPSNEAVIRVVLSKGKTVLTLIRKIPPKLDRIGEIIDTLTVPEDITGNSVFIVKIDSDDRETESNEYYNEKSVTIRIIPASISIEEYL